MDKRRLQTERRHGTSAAPGVPSSPLTSASPLQRHTRSGSSYGGAGNPRKAQTKAAAQRLAAVMSNKQDDDDGDDDYDQLDNSSVGRPTRPPSPMAKNIPQRRPSPLRKQQPYDDDNDEDAPVSNTTSIGLTATAKRSPSPARKSLARTRIPPAAADDEIDEDDLLVSSTTRIGLGGRAARPFSPMAKNIYQKRMPQATDKESDEEDFLVSGKASIGLARGRGMQPRPSVGRPMAQRPVQQEGPQPSDEDNDEDDLSNSSMSGKPTIGLGGRAKPSSSPLSVRVNQDQQRPTPAHASGQNSMEQSTSPSAGRSSLQSSVALSVGRSSALTSSSEQSVTPHSTSPGRQQLGVRSFPAEKRLDSNFRSMNNMKVSGTQQSASALQNELDVLLVANESLLQKLHLAEERCEEAEARAQLLEKQVKEVAQAASKGETQTQFIAALHIEYRVL
ncbi:hypothetical protein F3Y22_tig00111157pilonHSYRG00013 [Hibiscus syriacus]|uniref:Uncharacterized protein n=1 Tax=Hibiscus syriacus TaxID=106335 RepID=A0A6A2YXH9_HIBSY|nr:hypothetical protein F3Y22_tig00111157pilonHSYRG00013 [Hibiscus syriacus]